MCAVRRREHTIASESLLIHAHIVRQPPKEIQFALYEAQRPFWWYQEFEIANFESVANAARAEVQDYAVSCEGIW